MQYFIFCRGTLKMIFSMRGRYATTWATKITARRRSKDRPPSGAIVPSEGVDFYDGNGPFKCPLLAISGRSEGR